MLGYHKSRVIHLSRQLQDLCGRRDDLKLLLELQLQILGRIKHTEGNISRYRQTLGRLRQQLKLERLPKDAAAKLKRKIAALTGKVKQSQWMLFVWRCFGDGIAFAYLDKWAMKPLLYNLENPEVKQTAGHITGKDGFDLEIALLRSLVNAGVPALLTDLTNSIRHGDICLLADNDPQLIEVKASKNTNRRVERQTEDIRSIHHYLATDEATGVRGVPHIKRVELALPERNYLDILDEAISTALHRGMFVVDPEPGMRLVVLGGLWKPDYAEIFGGMERPVVYMLNEAKNSEAWGCYYPFSLSLKNPDNLYAFLHGDVYLVVAFDLAKVQSRATAMGMSFSCLDGADWVYQLTKPISGAAEPIVSKISTHFAARMAFELLSWEWVLRMEQLRLGQVENEPRKDEQA